MPTTTPTHLEPHPSREQNRLIIPAWAVLVSAVALWPFWKGLFFAREDYAYMVRDMMVPYNMPVNDLVMGVAAGAPRALPQDAVMAMLVPTIPATVFASWFIVVSSLIGVAFTARLVERMTNAPIPVQMVVSLFVIWNPYSIERLLQGHWSLAAAAWLLPPVAYFSAAGLRGMQKLMLAFCALTPTGWLLGGIIALTFEQRLRHRVETLVALVMLAMPWALVTAFNSPNVMSDSLSVKVFAARAEEGVGTLGALVGLGGIWNAQVVPTSRTALVAWISVILFAFMLLGFRQLCRVYPVVAAITVGCIVLPWLFATTSGLVIAGMIVENVPGAGLFRDAQKFVALALPGLVLMFATALCMTARWLTAQWAQRQPSESPETTRTYRIAARALSAALALVVVATVPTFPRDMQPLEQRPLKPVWQQVVNSISAAPASPTLLLPPGNYSIRDGIPVLAPSLKLLPGRPIDPGYLIVDGQIVDGNPRAMEVLSKTMNGDDELAERAVGWVIVDRSSVSPTVDMTKVDELLSNHRLVVKGDGIELYRVANPVEMERENSDTPLLVGMTMFWLVFGLGACMTLWYLVAWSSKHRGWMRWRYLSRGKTRDLAQD